MSTEATKEKKTTPRRKQAGDSTAPQAAGGAHPMIKIRTAPGRGGRPFDEERWPFSQLETASKDADGNITGMSIFIPESENPNAAIAAARKRHRGPRYIKFMTRKGMDHYPDEKGPLVKGVHIWKDPDQTPERRVSKQG
ncbi:hypothetical protein [Sphingobium sp. MK2]|uniref:hypothetical protein n=1 Tax=Sphingobium sp. MK2 TaxID=3116540 RepID=UPI0032E36111